jgi:protocatechuate 3,4-dioxygenase beta subunit
MKRLLAVCALGLFAFVCTAFSKSLGNAGTIEGTVVDQSGAAVPHAAVRIHNPVTGCNQATTTSSDGSFRLTNIPPNPYHMEVKAAHWPRGVAVTPRPRDCGVPATGIC